MKLSFRAVKGVPKRKQGVVYYAMMNKKHFAPHVIKACEAAIDFVCKTEYDKKMMTEFVSTDESTIHVAQKYFCSTAKITRLFSKYMEKAVKSITNV